jgi:trans-aconitate methyltransferase
VCFACADWPEQCEKDFVRCWAFVVQKWHHTFTETVYARAAIIEFVGMFAVLAYVSHLQSIECGLFVTSWKAYLVEQFCSTSACPTRTRPRNDLVFESEQIESA